MQTGQQTQARFGNQLGMLRAIETAVGVRTPAPGAGGIRGEAKVAYIRLVLEAGGVERSWHVHYGALGLATGTGYDGARKAIEALKRVGLIEGAGAERGGETVYIRDPQEATSTWRTRAAGDCDQGTLFPLEPNPPSEDAAGGGGAMTLPLPPARPESARLTQDKPACLGQIAQDEPVPTSETSSARARAKTLNIKHLPSEDEGLDVGCPIGSSSARRADSPRRADPTRLSASEYEAAVRLHQDLAARQAGGKPSEPQSLGGVLGAIRDRVDPAPGRRTKRAQDWITQIRQDVRDRHLAKFADDRSSAGGEAIVEHLAWLLTMGELGEGQLDRAIKALNSLDRRGKILKRYEDGSPRRAAVFVGIMRNILVERGLPLWQKGPKAAPAHRTAEVPLP